MARQHCSISKCLLGILFLIISSFGYIEMIHYYSNGNFDVVQTNENATELSGSGYSLTQCTLRCRRINTFEVFRTKDGRCYCSDKFLESPESAEHVVDESSIEGKIYKVTHRMYILLIVGFKTSLM